MKEKEKSNGVQTPDVGGRDEQRAFRERQRANFRLLVVEAVSEAFPGEGDQAAFRGVVAAKCKSFFSLFETFFGPFPDTLEDREVRRAWWELIARMPNGNSGPDVFTRIAAARESKSERPRLATFQAVLDSYLRANRKPEAPVVTQSPLFDFGKPGFPMQRPPEFHELPEGHVERLKDIRRRRIQGIISDQEYTDQSNEIWRKGAFAWSDYTREKRVHLAVRCWRIRDGDLLGRIIEEFKPEEAGLYGL